MDTKQITKDLLKQLIKDMRKRSDYDQPHDSSDEADLVDEALPVAKDEEVDEELPSDESDTEECDCGDCEECKAKEEDTSDKPTLSVIEIAKISKQKKPPVVATPVIEKLIKAKKK